MLEGTNGSLGEIVVLEDSYSDTSILELVLDVVYPDIVVMVVLIRPLLLVLAVVWRGYRCHVE